MNLYNPLCTQVPVSTTLHNPTGSDTLNPPKCLFWTVKYVCGCIYDEWYRPCQSNDNANQARQQKTWCYQRSIQEITDVLTLCEACYAKVDARVRKDGLKKVLQSVETFPLAEPLGMLIALENDEREQWKAFGRERQVLLLESEWYIPETEGPVDSGRLKLKRPRPMVKKGEKKKKLAEQEKDRALSGSA